MMRWTLVAIVTVGCGGSARHGATPRSEDPERLRIEAMKPASPYETRSVRGFSASTTCGQGPYHVDAAALGAHFGEQLEVNICAPRSLQGDYRFTQGTDVGAPQHFGSRNNSEHCVPTAEELARQAADPSAPSGPISAIGPARGPVATTAPAVAAAQPITLAAISEMVGETCPEGMFLTGILDYSMVTSSGDTPPWTPGLRLGLDIWSTEPLDLSGAVFIVIQRGVRASMTTDEWTRYRADYDNWSETWNAYLRGEVTAGRARYLDTTARAADAPPPPRAEVTPPRPSAHAEWIPGYWQHERDWIWSAGFWRVPQEDIVAEQTSEAPVAPPVAKIEAPPPQPAAGRLVWTPGYWAWNGSAYLWIEGAYRIPPQAGARWVAPTWTPRRGRVVLAPGGWSVQIGR
jgi:hypothetical protein